MDGKSIGLKIMWWSEMIISIRVLLFLVPVLINQYLAKNFLLSNLNDRFIALLSAAAIFYLIIGVMSIIGFRYWKITHYLAAILTLALTAGSLFYFGQPSRTVDLIYFAPVFFAMVLTVFTGFLGRKK